MLMSGDEYRPVLDTIVPENANHPYDIALGIEGLNPFKRQSRSAFGIKQIGSNLFAFERVPLA